MRLIELLTEVDYTLICGNADIQVDDITYNSKSNTKGTVFVAITHDENYISEAINGGAVAVVIESDIACYDENITYVKVEDARLALAYMSDAFFDHPQRKLFMIGITGTKGKTTTSYMVHTILSTCGIKTGLIGTIETIYGEEWYPQCNTTPESYVLYETLSKMVLSGIKAVVMEVSSQGLKHNRVAGITFDEGVFTNISPDHISEKEHKDFEEYLYCKSLLFSQCKHGIVNADDENSEYIMKNAVCPVDTFGVNNVATLMATDISLVNILGKEGVTFKTDNYSITLRTPGIFNVYNSLAAILATRKFELDMNTVAFALKNVVIKGRLEILRTKYPFTVIIDYAHNELSLRKLLETLRAYNPGRLICCFGCGGNRDSKRRVKMGRVSGELADITIVTSDNPRFENPRSIMDEIIEGVKERYGIFVPIESRKEAIEYAIHIGRPGDIIVFAGKGHEDYEEVCGVKRPFNEKNIIREMKD